MRRLSVVVLASAISCSAVAPAFGQSEKITIRRTPEPNQTIHMKMSQQMDMEMKMEGAELPPGMPSTMKMGSKVVSTATHKIGARNENGNINTEITIEEFNSESTMNGQAVPTADPSVARLLGSKITVTLDTEGKVVDVQSSTQNVGLPQDMFNQLLRGVSSGVPSTPMGVGEVVTSPLTIALPVPIANGVAARVSGQTEYKLVSLERDAAGTRIAKFDLSLTGIVSTDNQVSVGADKLNVGTNLNLNGVGTMVLDVDRGLARSSETRVTYGGKVKMAAPGAQLPDMDVQVLIVQTSTSGN